VTAAERTRYGSDLSEIYDVIYAGRGKDYLAESAEVADLVVAAAPGARSLLDVACGTGGHLRHLRRHFTRVAGVDRSPHMVGRARENLPGVPVHVGDMTGFRLPDTFDAAVCLFSSVGYLAGPAELDAAVATMAAHVRAGGVVLVEPWYTPEAFLPGYVADDLVRSGELVVARVSHSTRTGDRVPIVVHYLVADPERGIRHHTDVHEMTLFTDAQYRAAFERAGCAVRRLDPCPRFGCGLYVGVRGS
jgi:SAM-dependent methyltransferase